LVSFFQTHPCHFPITTYQTPLSGCASRVVRFQKDRAEPKRVPPLAFDSSLSAADTPLSVITESVLSVGTDCRGQPGTVRFQSPTVFSGCDFGPRAPPSSPIVFSPQATHPAPSTESQVNSPSRKLQSYRLLGTPEYLAPELLMLTTPSSEPRETAAVDWWALGIILFEMLTGSTPFTDDTPEAIFQNILNGDIPWPCSVIGVSSDSANDQRLETEADELSPAAVDLIKGLLSPSPCDRMLVVSRLRNCAFLASFNDWEHLDQLEMPFVPCPDDSTDTTYFEVSLISSQSRSVFTTFSEHYTPISLWVQTAQNSAQN
uniref:Serine/threonine-protein kinase greatwall n=1 Tax=Echinostoma caproni TaxID=27848 RepID=A0A183B233_9TREM